MSSQSLSIYVDVSIVSAGIGPAQASFGINAFVHESSVESGSRLHGPFLTAQDVIDFGYASGSPPHLYAQAFFSQQPNARQFYVGRADSGDADISASLDAMKAENPGGWFCTTMESRDAADIELVAAWTEPENKIAVMQCNDASLLSGAGEGHTATFGGTETDGDYDLIFAGFGLASPVTVTITRSTTPATNADLAAAMDAELDTQNGVAGDIEGLLASVSNASGVVTIVMTDGLAAGTITSSAPSPGTLTVVNTDDDIGSELFSLQYEKSSLWYYSDDAVYLDGAVSSRCLSYDLDAKRGAWGDKQLNGVAGDNLSNAQVTALRAVNVNYYSPAVAYSGTAVLPFTAPGWVCKGNSGAGQTIEISITKMWLQARLQEELATVKLSETHEIGFDDEGIGRFAAAIERVHDLGVRAGHLLPFTVPRGEEFAGTQTPKLFVPRLSSISAANRAAGILTFTGLVYIKGRIQKIVYNLQTKL